jgi:hypothetical protein
MKLSFLLSVVLIKKNIFKKQNYTNSNDNSNNIVIREQNVMELLLI